MEGVRDKTERTVSLSSSAATIFKAGNELISTRHRGGSSTSGQEVKAGRIRHRARRGFTFGWARQVGGEPSDSSDRAAGCVGVRRRTSLFRDSSFAAPWAHNHGDGRNRPAVYLVGL